MKTLSRTVIAAILISYIRALAVEPPSAEDFACSDMEYHDGPYFVFNNGEVIENMIIVMWPGDADIALTINRDDVTVRNVIIYHPVNSFGIRGWEPKNLELYNVEIVAYGNPWGAQPCPTRRPFFGAGCNNIQLYTAENLKMTNVRVENGSKGIAFNSSPGAQLKNIEAFNMRGPFPAGSCFAFSHSDGTVLENFYCYNDPEISWTEDSVSTWRSSNVIMRNGVIDGNNSLTGMAVMYEGSEEGVHGGILENVEAINCQGCFAGYPMTNFT